MQNKHYFFFSFLGIPTFGEGGGVKPIGPKSQLLPKICFGGFPYWFIKLFFKKYRTTRKKYQSESAQLYNKDFRSKLANTSEQVNAILKDHKDHSFKTGI